MSARGMLAILCTCFALSQAELCPVSDALSYLYRSVETGFDKGVSVQTSDVTKCVKDALLFGGKTLTKVYVGFDRQKGNSLCKLRGSSMVKVYTQLSVWPQRLAGACSDHRCNTGFTCIPQDVNYVCQSENVLQKDCTRHPVETKNLHHCKSLRINDQGRRRQNTKSRPDKYRTYDCASEQNSSFPRIVAVPENGRLHIFNHTGKEFETFKAKLGRRASEIVMDFVRCRILFVIESIIFVMDINTSENLVQHPQHGKVKFLRLAPKVNRVAFVVVTNSFAKISTLLDGPYKFAFKLDISRTIGDISIDTDGRDLYWFYTDGSMYKRDLMQHRTKKITRILVKSYFDKILLYGKPAIAVFKNDIKRGCGYLVIFNIEPRLWPAFEIKPNIKHMYSSQKGWIFAVDDKHTMYVYDKHVQLIETISLLTFSTTSPIAFYFG